MTGPRRDSAPELGGRRGAESGKETAYNATDHAGNDVVIIYSRKPDVTAESWARLGAGVAPRRKNWRRR